MTRFAASLLGLVFSLTASANSPDPAALAVPPEQAARARDLVRQLGSEAYRDRDRAARELRGMGRLAVAALAGAVQADTDPEIRARCEDLLPAAEAADMSARVAAFLADTDRRYEHDLPGWNEFRAVAGEDKPARALFVAILNNPDNHPLLQATRRPTDRLPAAVVARRQQLQFKLNAPRKTLLMFNGDITQTTWPDPADIAALLLAESLAPDRGVVLFNLGSHEYQLSTYLYSGKGRDAVGADPALQKLVVNWLLTRNGAFGPAGALNLCDQLQNQIGPDAVNAVAVRALSAEGLPSFYKMKAFNTLLRNSAKDQLPAIRKFFADDAVLEPGVPGVAAADALRMRDTALLVAVRLTGQSPSEYGYTFGPSALAQPMLVPAAPANRMVMTGGDSLSTLRFRSSATATAEEKRAAAFKKWDEWAAKNAK